METVDGTSFYYGNGGTHQYNNGSNQIDPRIPREPGA